MSEELIQGISHITVDVRTRGLVLLGGGPIASCTSFEYTQRLSAAGSFRATFALRDPRTDLIVPKRTLLDFYTVGEDTTALAFRGLVEARAIAFGQDGVLELQVSGRDMAGELDEIPVGFLTLRDGTDGVDDGPAQIMTLATLAKGVGWSLMTGISGYATTATPIYAKFAGESALNALTKIASHLGEHWITAPDGTRRIAWLRKEYPGIDSRVRAIQSVGEAQQAHENPNICFIQRFESNADAHEQFNRIYPYGSGRGGSRLTLAGTTRTAPTGFTLDSTANYIQNDAAATADTLIGRYVEFKDVRPIEDQFGGVSDADLQTAANLLFDVAYELLIRSDDTSDNTTYTLDVAMLPRRVKVGQVILVEYYDDRYAVSAPFVILEMHHTFGAAGERLSSLTVSSIATWKRDGLGELVSNMEAGRIFSSHPQMNANSYTAPYRVFVGRSPTTEKAEIRFRFRPRVLKVTQVIFFFTLAPLVDTGNTTGGIAVVTEQNTATTTDISSEDTTEGGSSHGHGVTVDYAADPSASGTSRLVYIDVSPPHFVSSLGASSQVVTSNSESSHTHGMEHTHEFEHTHEIDVGAALTSTFGIFREVPSNTLVIDELEYRVNGTGDFLPIVAAPTFQYIGPVGFGLEGDMYSVDITEDVVNDTVLFRPERENNFIEVRQRHKGVTSISGNGTTVTVVTSTPHLMATDDTVSISGSVNYNGLYGPDENMTVVNSTTFTFDSTATGSETVGDVGVSVRKTAMLDVLLEVDTVIQDSVLI